MEQLQGLANRDPLALRWGQGAAFHMMLGVEDQRYRIQVADGTVHQITALPAKLTSWDFAVTGPGSSWQAHWAPVPAPTFHDLIAMRTAGHIAIEGNLTPFFQHILYVKRLLELPRAQGWLS